MDIAAEFLALSYAAHGADHLIADDKGPDIAPFAFGNELLDQHVLLLALQQFDDGLRRLHRLGQQHADPLRAFKQFDDDRRAADTFDRRQHVLLVAHERRLRNADVVSAENLQAAQLVTRIGDTRRRIGAEDIHLLKLSYDGCTEVGDRSADSRKHGIVVRELFLAEVKIRLPLVEIDRELERVQNLDFVSSLLGGFAKAPRAVASGAAGQNGKFHVCFSRFGVLLVLVFFFRFGLPP